MKKVILTTISLFALLNIGFSQGQTCLPTDPNYCNPPCSTCIDIINDTNCDLYFAWGYQGYPCSDPDVPAGIVLANNQASTPPMPWYAPCMKFCDYPCECPTMFRIFDSSSNTFVAPWGNGIFTCCWSGTFNGFIQCNGTLISADVTVNAGGCVTVRFY
ncbi:MAG: hypothetical protein J5I91_10025 [Bacteroidetes bacterium]|nr:hypothetical protein [Bacteroidota bacterium]